ncbi:hypothetical protein KY335_02170 [Candidatus Woesearchaeota archaeon]|nr:hypothetical protein [Candidatus Woesearchaeota archaeon]
MKRKLVKQGTATLTVSLPTSWTNKFRLKPGDEIDIEEISGDLFLRSKKEFKIQKSKIDITDLPAALVHRYILSAYKKGSDEIDVVFTNSALKNMKDGKVSSTARFVQEIVNNLVGVEVIDQGKSFVKIKQISEVSQEEFENILRRIFLLLLSMGEDAYEIISKRSRDYSILLNKHDSIDKFVNYSIRLLNRKGHLDFKKTSLYYYLVQELEEISDVFLFLSREVLKNNWRITKESMKLFSLTNSTLRLYYNLFYKFNKQDLIKILYNRREFFDKVNIYSKKYSADNIFLSRLANIHLRILNLSEIRMSLE